MTFINGISFSVKNGERIAFIGPNGAGKSTLLKVLSGRLEETAGEIAIGELTFKHRTAEALARAGVCSIPEGRGIFPNLSVHDNLVMWSYRLPKRADWGAQVGGKEVGGGANIVPSA